MIDYDNFFISGDSAGGHIASLIANAQTNDFFPPPSNYYLGK